MLWYLSTYEPFNDEVLHNPKTLSMSINMYMEAFSNKIEHHLIHQYGPNKTLQWLVCGTSLIDLVP